jgi:hypothetical protein
LAVMLVVVSAVPVRARRRPGGCSDGLV